MTKQEVLEKLNKAYDRDNEDYKETADTWCLGSMHSLDMAIQLVGQMNETGKWMGSVCSCCGESVSEWYNFKFCPMCGAKMEDYEE